MPGQLDSKHFKCLKCNKIRRNKSRVYYHNEEMCVKCFNSLTSFRALKKQYYPRLYTYKITKGQVAPGLAKYQAERRKKKEAFLAALKDRVAHAKRKGRYISKNEQSVLIREYEKKELGEKEYHERIDNLIEAVIANRQKAREAKKEEVQPTFKEQFECDIYGVPINKEVKT